MSGGFSSASTSQMPSGCSRMIVSLSSSVIGSMMILRSIKCLDVVCLLARLLEHIGQPTLLSLAADHATYKAEHGGQIVTIAPDVLTRELGIAFQKLIQVLGLREKVRGVPRLRNFRNQHVAPHEQVFVSKQEPCPAAFAELIEVVRLVVWTPRDMVRLQVRGRVDLIEPALDLRVLDGDLLALVANMLNQIGVLAEKGMDRLGVLKVLRNVRRRVNLKPGWERGLPFSENPLAVVQTVFSGVNEGRLDLDTSP